MAAQSDSDNGHSDDAWRLLRASQYLAGQRLHLLHWTRDLTLVLRGFRRGPLAALGAAAMLSTGPLLSC